VWGLPSKRLLRKLNSTCSLSLSDRPKPLIGFPADPLGRGPLSLSVFLEDFPSSSVNSPPCVFILCANENLFFCHSLNLAVRGLAASFRLMTHCIAMIYFICSFLLFSCKSSFTHQLNSLFHAARTILPFFNCAFGNRALRIFSPMT